MEKCVLCMPYRWQRRQPPCSNVTGTSSASTSHQRHPAGLHELRVLPLHAQPYGEWCHLYERHEDCGGGCWYQRNQPLVLCLHGAIASGLCDLTTCLVVWLQHLLHNFKMWRLLTAVLSACCAAVRTHGPGFTSHNHSTTLFFPSDHGRDTAAPPHPPGRKLGGCPAYPVPLRAGHGTACARFVAPSVYGPRCARVEHRVCVVGGTSRDTGVDRGADPSLALGLGRPWSWFIGWLVFCTAAQPWLRLGAAHGGGHSYRFG